MAAPPVLARPSACSGIESPTAGLPRKLLGYSGPKSPPRKAGRCSRDYHVRCRFSWPAARREHDVYMHPVHRHCLSACCVRAGARAACCCVCARAFSPARPGAQRRLLTPEGGKEKRSCASSSWTREVAGSARCPSSPPGSKPRLTPALLTF